MNMTDAQIDVLTEIINIGSGRAGSMLTDLLHSQVILNIPSVRIISAESLESEVGSDQFSAIQLGFKGALSGKTELVFPLESADNLVDVVMGQNGEENAEADLLKTGILMEVGNIVINGVMGSVSNMINQRIHFSVPSYVEGSIRNRLFSNYFDPRETLLLAETKFTIEEHHIDGKIIMLFKFGSFEILLSAIDTLMEKVQN